MELEWSQQSQDKYLAYDDDSEVKLAFDQRITVLEENGNAGFFVDDLWQSEDPSADRIANALFAGSWGRPVRVTWAVVQRPPNAAPPPLLALAFFSKEEPELGKLRRLIGLHLLYRQTLKLR